MQEAKREDHGKETDDRKIFGKVSMKHVTPMSDLSLDLGTVLVAGDVFAVDHKELRRQKNVVVRFDVTDYTSSVRVSQFMRDDEAKAIVKGVKVGQRLLIQGYLEMDRYDGDLVLRPTGIVCGEKNIRQDTMPQKRVELHLHTRMSAMDALIKPKELVQRAAQWGMPAVAVTDHGGAHSFPELWKAGKEYGVKIIYGVEGYCVDDGDSSTKGKPIRHICLLAKDRQGLKNLYRIISLSHLEHYRRYPIMPKRLIDKNREGLMIGSACAEGELYQAILQGHSQEELERVAAWYDYLEIMPLSNHHPLAEGGAVRDEEASMEINRKIAALGQRLGKPVCATGDAHFLDPEEEIYRHIILASKGFDDADRPNPLYFHTTDEMLEEFSYLGKEKAFEVVVTNTDLIADQVETFDLLPEGPCLPKLENSKEELKRLVVEALRRTYGEEPPALVSERVNAELNMILDHDYDVIYLAAQKLVQGSLEHGYLVGTRGSVGSSLVAFLAGVTEVNPLPSHYRCPKCKHADFDVVPQYGCGADLPDAVCPVCGTAYEKDGFNIPFETFLGLHGEKVPDIDLNVSGEYQDKAIEHLERLFGKDHVFRAGTIGTVAFKTAFGYVKRYLEERGLKINKAEEERLANGCTGVKRTTGQHPGGMVVIPQDREIYDFCPVQRPADDVGTDIITTHFDYPSIQPSLLKLDLLGHDDPTMLKMLQDLTAVDPQTIPLDDPDTMSLFTSSEKLGFTDDPLLGPTGAVALPEFGSAFVRQMLEKTSPQHFSTLVRLSGFSHGIGAWLDNARNLILNDGVSVSDTVGCRDDILLYLEGQGMERTTAYEIMEAVRKGQVARDGFQKGWAEGMKAHNVPQWYMDSLAKISYLFPKAHAVAYVMMAYRIAWFKVHRPLAFYAAYFIIRAKAFDAIVMCQGIGQVKRRIQEIDDKGKDASALEEDMLVTLEVCYEFYLRGFRFETIDLYRSDATKFIVDEEKGTLLPPFTSVPGLGEPTAQYIVEQRKGRVFHSLSEFTSACPKLSRWHIEGLKAAGALEGLL